MNSTTDLNLYILFMSSFGLRWENHFDQIIFFSYNYKSNITKKIKFFSLSCLQIYFEFLLYHTSWQHPYTLFFNNLWHFMYHININWVCFCCSSHTFFFYWLSLVSINDVDDDEFLNNTKKSKRNNLLTLFEVHDLFTIKKLVWFNEEE